MTPTSPGARPPSAIKPAAPAHVGVRIAGTGSAVPSKRITNFDLERMMDTSDEWIVQRTGIRERRICDPMKGESCVPMSTLAIQRALEDARMKPSELDLLIVGTVTGEMTCPSTACRVAANIGATGMGAFDISAACCGFLYGLNIAHTLIRSGSYRCIGVIGCDIMSKVMDYSNRAVSILFGDGAGAAILRATDDTSRGPLAFSLHADGSRWEDLYLPQHQRDFPKSADHSIVRVNALQMNGREVYKFAVGTFADLIDRTLKDAGLTADDIAMFVCHQSNARMLEAARKRFNINEERLYVNIDKYGNCSAGSVPICLDELRKMGKCREGELVMFVAFGGGLTWASSLWRL